MEEEKRLGEEGTRLGEEERRLGEEGRRLGRKKESEREWLGRKEERYPTPT